jgi:hypothetical protein
MLSGWSSRRADPMPLGSTTWRWTPTPENPGDGNQTLHTRTFECFCAVNCGGVSVRRPPSYSRRTILGTFSRPPRGTALQPAAFRATIRSRQSRTPRCNFGRASAQHPLLRLSPHAYATPSNKSAIVEFNFRAIITIVERLTLEPLSI